MFGVYEISWLADEVFQEGRCSMKLIITYNCRKKEDNLKICLK